MEENNKIISISTQEKIQLNDSVTSKKISKGFSFFGLVCDTYPLCHMRKNKNLSICL